MFAPVPTSMEPSARLGWPAVRMKLFMPNATNCKGQPAMMTVMKARACGSTASSAAEARRMGSSAARPTIQATTPAPTSSTKLVPSTRSATRFFRSPSLMAASALPPTPTSMATATMNVMAGFATVVAARPFSPTAAPTYTASMTL